MLPKRWQRRAVLCVTYPPFMTFISVLCVLTYLCDCAVAVKNVLVERWSDYSYEVRDLHRVAKEVWDK